MFDFASKVKQMIKQTYRQKHHHLYGIFTPMWPYLGSKVTKEGDT